MAQDTQYGGFWARLVALIIDDAIVFIILLAALLAMGTVGATVGMESMMGAAASLVATFVPLLYWAVLESSSRQATFGKRIMGLEVTDLEGNRLSFLRAFLRSLAKIISSIPFGLGFLIAAFTARKQALHDIIVKTLVVRTGPSHLWKVIVALIVGLVLMVASAAGLFYYVLMPMFKKGVDSAMQDVMKGAPQMKTIPAPAAKAPPAPQSKPEAPAPQVSAAAAPAGKQGPDPDFDAAVGKPLAGLEKPNTTRAGPAILELSTMFPTSFWVKVYLPAPSLSDPALMPGPIVTVNRVLDSGGRDYYDAGSTFEKDDFFRRPSLSPAKNPVPHLAGTRNVHLMPGLSEQALQKVEGQVNFTVPADPRSVTFEAKETGTEKPVHDSSVSLQSVSGNAATLHFRGASENLLLVRGYGADGNPLAVDSRQTLPQKQDVDGDFTITFKGPPAKLEVTVAAKVIERFFPFSLARGAVAGPPSAAVEGVTLPSRSRAAKVAAAAPTSAPAPVVAAQVKPEAATAKAELKAHSAPAATPEPAKPAPAAQKSTPAKSVAATPPPAQVAKMVSEPRARAPRRRVSLPATLPAPAPAAASAPAAEPRVITPKYNDVMTAVMVGDEDAVNQLLDLGWWVDKPSSIGLTPLMAAVMNRDARMVRVLLARGADPNAQAPGGVTALRLARDRNDAVTAALLEQRGAR